MLANSIFLSLYNEVNIHFYVLRWYWLNLQYNKRNDWLRLPRQIPVVAFLMGIFGDQQVEEVEQESIGRVCYQQGNPR